MTDWFKPITELSIEDHEKREIESNETKKETKRKKKKNTKNKETMKESRKIYSKKKKLIVCVAGGFCWEAKAETS